MTHGNGKQPDAPPTPLMSGSSKPTKDEVRLALGPFALMLTELQERVTLLEAQMAYNHRHSSGGTGNAGGIQ